MMMMHLLQLLLLLLLLIVTVNANNAGDDYSNLTVTMKNVTIRLIFREETLKSICEGTKQNKKKNTKRPRENEREKKSS